ncbi:ER degradation-enhancing alpha-mannosidase-like protein 3 [Echinococcus granulosus]|nr:ER degradation-enhancing alpha-mannosidase-like protein 3 [Echinococcus granulosus]
MGSLATLVCFLLIPTSLAYCKDMLLMSSIRREELKNKSKEMFFHAYNNYMLMPLSCKGRYRDRELSRGTVDEALGNFSLSLIDSLDTLFLLGELDEFEHAVLRVIHDVSFDQDVDVSVFETNIRVLGGLLGGHVSVLALKEYDPSRISWYRGQLLDMAVDLGSRLLPAFNTSTGLPFPRINLRTGKPSPLVQTCTACAGTLILEFAALSRFSGDPVYEMMASNALSYLWQQRNRYSDLVGTEINVNSGEWIRRESGVGAGIDSYYESLLKAYGLLGDPVYLHRFQTHYSAIERYMGGPGTKAFPFSFLSVFMHKPSERCRFYMDALQAFWPGLQTINGDVSAAVAHHEMLFMVHKEHGLLPEAFTTDMDIYWPYYLIRPELVESTYLLYKGTSDPYYLYVGAELLESIEQHSRVPCGFAAVEDIRTMEHSDRMDSFVLAETFKYFYLLFSEPSDLPIDLEQYVLTTEAHVLPIGLPKQHPPVIAHARLVEEAVVAVPGALGRAWGGTCAAPSSSSTLRRLLCTRPTTCRVGPWHQHYHLETIRQPLRSMAKSLRSRHLISDHDSSSLPLGLVTPTSFNANNITHLQMLRQMGIMVVVGKNGEIQLKLNRNQADSPLLGLSGVKFIEEVIDLSNARSQGRSLGEVVISQTVALIHPPHFGRIRFEAGPSMFTFYPGESPNITDATASPTLITPDIDWQPVIGPLVIAEPFDACTPVYSDGLLLANEQLHADFVEPSFYEDSEFEGASKPRRLLKDAIVLVKRGGCMFLEKAINVKQMGARGVIVVDSTPGTSSAKDKLFYMSGDAPDGTPPRELMQLPFVFVFHEEGRALVSAMGRRWKLKRKPVLAMIAKKNDIPKILSQSLHYLDSISQPRTDGHEQCFELSAHVETVQSLCPQEAIRADETHQEGKDGWNITLGPVDETETFVLLNKTSGHISPRNPSAWAELIDKNWPTANHDEYCKDLMLAVSEAALSQITETEDPRGRASVTRLSHRWCYRVGKCLRGISTTNAVIDECHRPYLRLRLTLTQANSC